MTALKHMLLLLPLLLIRYSSYVAGYGTRGAQERVLYYYAYLAEELLGGTYTVAPGCVGRRPGGRCNLNEFLEHIWYPYEDGTRKDDTPPKKISVFKKNDPKDFTKMSILQAQARISNYIDPVTDERITWNIDPQKLLPGSSTFQEVLSKIGAPIGALDETKSDDAKRIKQNGQDAARLLKDLRESDAQSFLRNFILKDMNMGKGDLIMRPGRNTLNGAKVDLIDVDATINSYTVDHENPLLFRTEFEQSLVEAMRTNEKAREHAAVIAAADEAERGAGCK
ncbi:MAG: hypothetical protein M1820_006583 [Bogoriella megaspora]|nr:MAG: hypothetical protein M1820_006583 [Bogoriella megaspora]